MAKKAIWYNLAVAFKQYIRDDYKHVMVAQQKCPGDKFKSVYIRVWCYVKPEYQGLVDLLDKENSASITVSDDFLDSRIRDTILFQDDMIHCTNVEHGFHHIDLGFPLAFEQLLGWMKHCDLVDSETALTGQLA